MSEALNMWHSVRSASSVVLAILSFQEFGHGQAKRISYSIDVIDTDISLLSLNRTNVGSVKTADACKLFLRPFT